MTDFKCFFLFLVLAFLPLEVRAASITNITRMDPGLTRERLLTLSPSKEDTNINSIISRRLDKYALLCCAIYYSYDVNCRYAQMAYYAEAPKTMNGQPIRDDEIINYVEEHYNPLLMHESEMQLACGRGTPTPDQFYPYFALPDLRAQDHAEAQLLPIMLDLAVEKMNNPTNFWLYTYKSPCVTQCVHGQKSCLNKIFILAEILTTNNDHTMNVGFSRWFTWPSRILNGQHIDFTDARQCFCESQCAMGDNQERFGVDFWKGAYGPNLYNTLTFTKIFLEGRTTTSDSTFMNGLEEYHC